MKGFRTIAANVVGATIVPWIVGAVRTYGGVELTTEQQLEITANVFAYGNMLLRYFTSTPLGGKIATVDGVIAELKRRALKNQPTPKDINS